MLVRARTHLLVDPARVDGDDDLKKSEVRVKKSVLLIRRKICTKSVYYVSSPTSPLLLGFGFVEP